MDVEHCVLRLAVSGFRCRRNMYNAIHDYAHSYGIVKCIAQNCVNFGEIILWLQKIRTKLLRISISMHSTSILSTLAKE